MSEDNEEEFVKRINEDALELMREDASTTLECLLSKHDAHQKKAMQMLQLNGIILSILIAGGAQVNTGNSPNIFLYLGPFLFTCSALLAGVALRGKELQLGMSYQQVDSNIEAELDKTQYLLWYFVSFYKEAVQDLHEATWSRARWVRWSVYSLLGGLVSTIVGVLLWSEILL